MNKDLFPTLEELKPSLIRTMMLFRMTYFYNDRSTYYHDIERAKRVFKEMISDGIIDESKFKDFNYKPTEDLYDKFKVKFKTKAFGNLENYFDSIIYAYKMYYLMNKVEPNYLIMETNIPHKKILVSNDINTLYELGLFLAYGHGYQNLNGVGKITWAKMVPFFADFKLEKIAGRDYPEHMI